MIEDITNGTSGTLIKKIGLQDCTERGGFHIFATPDLVLLLELTAIQALAPYLPETQSTVGTRVDIAHTAATVLGQTVTCTATVIEIDRRRVVFEITANDGVDDIVAGTHERFVVDLDKFVARLAEKADAVRS